MTKTRSTKQALLMSALALVMCLSMLVGSTMAWFTDSVTSTGNKIQAGTLKLDLELYNGTAYESIKESKKAIFDYSKWEPGYTDVKLLKIENNGTLALKWYAKFVSTNAVTALADVIDVYVLPSATELTMPTDRNLEAAGYTRVGTVREFINTIETTTKGVLEGNSYAYLGIALKMQETAGNDYQGKTIGAFDILVLATQQTAESDSFNNQYDVDAEYLVEADSAEALSTALQAGGKVVVSGNIDPTETIVVPEWGQSAMELFVDAGKVDSLSGGEYVLDQGAKYGIVASAVAGQSVTLSDMNIEANSQWSMLIDNSGDNIVVDGVNITAKSGAGLYAYGLGSSVTTLNNVKINHEKLDPNYEASTPWAATAVAASSGHTVVINDGVYVGSSTAVFLYSSGGNITINGGTFKAPNVIIADINGYVSSVVTINGGSFDGKLQTQCNSGYCPAGPAVIYINGGNFTNFSDNGYSNIKISGGTFDVAPASRMIANGHQVIDNGDGTWSVVEIAPGA